jgi:hypothetical protein
LGRRGALRVLALLVVATALGAACGGGGGGGGGGGPVDPPTASLTFTPAQSQPNNSLALVRSNGNDPNTLVLDLRAMQVADVYGVAFDLTFPANLRYDSATEGTFLSAGGASTSLQVTEANNRLTVGLTRLGGLTGVSGDGTLLSLRFSAVAAGNGSLAFVAPTAYNANSIAYTVQWVGGTVAVVR